MSRRPLITAARRVELGRAVWRMLRAASAADRASGGEGWVLEHHVGWRQRELDHDEVAAGLVELAERGLIEHDHTGRRPRVRPVAGPRPVQLTIGE